jgi:hypothetical protein
METLLATYAVAWAVVTVYASWIAVANGRLARRVESLKARLGEQPVNETPHVRVA